MAATLPEREAAFLAFNAEFERNGFGNAPKGLVDLLRSYWENGPKDGETSQQLRKRIYKRLWCVMWFGSSIGNKNVGSGDKPTYVYPATLKRVVRSLLPDYVAEYDDPSGPKVYKVNIGDLAETKWPQRSKKQK